MFGIEIGDIQTYLNIYMKFALISSEGEIEKNVEVILDKFKAGYADVL
jgi:hypothetical protein